MQQTILALRGDGHNAVLCAESGGAGGEDCVLLTVSVVEELGDDIQRQDLQRVVGARLLRNLLFRVVERPRGGRRDRVVMGMVTLALLAVVRVALTGRGFGLVVGHDCAATATTAAAHGDLLGLGSKFRCNRGQFATHLLGDCTHVDVHQRRKRALGIV